MERTLPDDGLHTPAIKAHSVEKILRHDMYAHLFTTGMKNKWPQRAYIGLYSGAGRARLPSGEIVETTAMGALREDFTHYVFVDSDERCIKSLQTRARPLAAGRPIRFIHEDVNRAVPAIHRALPSYSRERGLLSLCFVDPFDASLQHATLADLASRFRIDFLILLALSMDARRNFRKYYQDTTDDRIAKLIDAPDWREELDGSGEAVIPFLVRKFNEAMVRVGYEPALPLHHHPVRVSRMGVLLYYLVLYSKSKVGQQFWEKALGAADPQGALGI
jgi:three-Cys-motif partner protein